MRSDHRHLTAHQIGCEVGQSVVLPRQTWLQLRSSKQKFAICETGAMVNLHCSHPGLPSLKGMAPSALFNGYRWGSPLQIVWEARASDPRRVLAQCCVEETCLCKGLTMRLAAVPGGPVLALLWQIYSCRCLLRIHFRQCGHRCGGGRAMSSRMAWRTAGKVG